MNNTKIKHELWKRGNLKWKVRKHQLPIYEAVWGAITNKRSKYVLNCARRFGKTTVLCIVILEFAIRNANVQIRFAAPSAKQLEKIIFPIIAMLMTDCPSYLKPKFSSQKNVFKFTNGSEIHLAGVDAHHAESLRGVASHLNVLDEAGSMDNLRYVMQDVLMPLTLTTGGTTLLASTPAPYLEHDYTHIAHAAKEEKAFSQFTIHDNKALTPQQYARAVEDSGGENTTTFKREYLCQFVTDSELIIIPEWNDIYVAETPKDQHYPLYHKYVAMDIGFRDNTAVIFGYYNFRDAKLIIEDELTFSIETMVTDRVAKAILAKERELWGDQKPFRRIADNNDPRLLQDFSLLHNLPFIPTTKDQLHAMVNETRMWLGDGRVTIDPKCKQTIGCIQFAIWKKEGTRRIEFANSATYKHYDHLAALIYMLRNVDTHTNPIPQLYGVDPSKQYINQQQLTDKSANALQFERMFK